MDTPRLRRRDPLRLPLADELTFCLRDIAQKLQNNVRDQRSCQITVLPGIQQRHIQHKDGRALFPRNDPPLLQYFIIIPPQPVDTLDDKCIPGSQPPEQLPVALPLKIRAGALVQINIPVRNAGSRIAAICRASF